MDTGFPGVNFPCISNNRKIISKSIMLIIAFLFPVYAFAGQYTIDKEVKKASVAKNRKKCYEARFFSLKRGNTIGPSLFILHDNGLFELHIKGETLVDTAGTYSLDDFSFDAELEFNIHGRPYHYACHFKGLSIFGDFLGGVLTLREYTQRNRLTQQVPFLFFATKENQKNKEGKRLLPFF